MRQYGYVRVSSKEQNPDRQLAAMQAQGIQVKDIYMDKQSGKDFDRTEYKKLIRKLAAGDKLVIKSIDRLGRNYEEILEEWRKITKVIGADIRVLDFPLLNTDIEHDNLTGIFVADLVLQILAYVAEQERDFIRRRQAEGIAIAKEKGVRFGCRKQDVPLRFEEYYNKWLSGKITVREGASQLGMSKSTFFRRCKELKNYSSENESIDNNCFKK